MSADRIYKDLVEQVLNHGERIPSRTGCDCISFPGTQHRYDLTDGRLPLLSTKKMSWKTVWRELQWFIRGDTTTDFLKEHKVRIWDANTDRAFLDGRGLNSYHEGEVGPHYGHQWRNSGGDWQTGQGGVDQLQLVLDGLRTDRYSRRHIVTAWVPYDIDRMCLPPCHMTFQFLSRPGRRLTCLLVQRSGDVGLGVPFNIVSYGMLAHLVASMTGHKAVELVHTIHDAHIYVNHLDALKEQLKREERVGSDPRVMIDPTVKDWSEIKDSTLSVEGYVTGDPLYMEMAV